MRTAVAETSLMAYADLRKSGTASNQRSVVFARLAGSDEGMTNAELGDSLGLPASTVAGRVNELKKAGKVAVCAVRKCRVTGNTAKAHGVQS